MVGVDVIPLADARLLAPAKQFIEVAPVVNAGVYGQAAFGLQVLQKSVQPMLHVMCHANEGQAVALESVMQRFARAEMLCKQQPDQFTQVGQEQCPHAGMKATGILAANGQ